MNTNHEVRAVMIKGYGLYIRIDCDLYKTIKTTYRLFGNFFRACLHHELNLGVDSQEFDLKRIYKNDFPIIVV